MRLHIKIPTLMSNNTAYKQTPIHGRMVSDTGAMCQRGLHVCHFNKWFRESWISTCKNNDGGLYFEK